MIICRSASQPTASILNTRRDGLRRLFGSMVQDRRETIQRPVEDCARLAGMESSEWAAVEAGYIPADPSKLRSMAAALEIRYAPAAADGPPLSGCLGRVAGAPILITR